MTDDLRYAISKALTAAGIILYIPANFLPVMTITITGQVEPLTVMGGVFELYDTGLVPVAAVVFLASVLVPIVKLLSLSWMLSLHGTDIAQSRRTKFHAFLTRIGTWAMVDIFLLSILVAVGQLGILASVQAEPGALFFAAMIICTLYAADIYKTYMIWHPPSPKST
ncbi:MAG: paraquat-inducible protein A [Spartobacteria bacterium]